MFRSGKVFCYLDLALPVFVLLETMFVGVFDGVAGLDCIRGGGECLCGRRSLLQYPCLRRGRPLMLVLGQRLLNRGEIMDLSGLGHRGKSRGAGGGHGCFVRDRCRSMPSCAKAV